MPQQQTNFDFSLTEKDRDLLRSFKRLLELDGKTEFSSDDFRMYGLDRFLKDKAHGIGGLFAKWKHQRQIVDTGKTKRSVLPSNNLRRISVYKWKDGEEVEA